MKMKGGGFNSQYLLYTGVVLLVLSALYWLYSNIESHKVEVDKGFKGEALSNDYLAAEYFLLSMGQSAKKIKLFSPAQTVLNAHDTLLIPNVRLSFDQRRSNEMLEWVESGGHLIITAQVDSEKLSEQPDHILERLGIKLERQSLAEESEKSELPVNISSLDNEDFLLVDFDDYLTVVKTNDFDAGVIWSADDVDRTHAIQIKFGRGKVTVLSDMRIFKNEYIDSYDHAAFLYSLTQGAYENVDTSVFYYSLFEDQMSLIQWLWQNARLLIISLLVVIVIVLWRLIPRFGPLINVHQPIRREFLNHLSAAGNFHWRQGHYNKLLTDVRINLSHEVKRKKPEWINLNKQDQIEYFSVISQLNTKQVEKALFNLDINHANEFIEIIKLLEIMRKTL